MRTRTLVAVGVLVALLLAGGLSFYASSSPDGLNRVAEDHGFAKTEKRHTRENSPFAGYSTRGVTSSRMSTGLAGVVGALVVLGLSGGLALVVRRRGGASTGSPGKGHGEDARSTDEHGGTDRADTRQDA